MRFDRLKQRNATIFPRTDVCSSLKARLRYRNAEFRYLAALYRLPEERAAPDRKSGLASNLRNIRQVFEMIVGGHDQN